MYTLYDLSDYIKPISYFKDTTDILTLDEQLFNYKVYPFSIIPLAKSIEIINALHYDGINVVNGKRKHIRYDRLEEIKERSDTDIFYSDASEKLRHEVMY